MLIVCPNCATSYDLDVASLRPNGRKVRCVRCKTVWQAELSHADRLMAAAEALAPVRRTVEAMAEAAAGEWGDDTEAGEAMPRTCRPRPRPGSTARKRIRVSVPIPLRCSPFHRANRSR